MPGSSEPRPQATPGATPGEREANGLRTLRFIPAQGGDEHAQLPRHALLLQAGLPPSRMPDVRLRDDRRAHYGISPGGEVPIEFVPDKQPGRALARAAGEKLRAERLGLALP